VTLFPVPMLPPERKPAAAVQSIALIRRPDGKNVMRIIIKRDLSQKIESFTFRYRFSNLPVYAADPEHKFNTYVYTEADINASDRLTFNGALSNRQPIECCSAYISEIKLASGQILTFEPSEFRFVLRPKKKPATENAPVAPPADAPAAPDVPPPAEAAPDTPAPEAPAKPADKKKTIRRTIILTLFIFTLLTEAVAGVYLYRYTGVKKSAEMLMGENCYNEAYKIASDAGYNGLLQRVCEKASVYYFSNGDLESAYVYAYGAPEPFTDTVVDYAAQSVVSIVDGTINENAFRVAKMTAEDSKFDAILRSMCDVLTKRGDYANALRVVSELREEAERITETERIFTDALNAYIADHRYDALTAFIDEMAADTTFKKSIDEIVAAAIDCCSHAADNAGILYLADRYPDHAEISAAQAVIDPGDPGVRAEFAAIYPMLSAEQKRTYHSKSIAVWNSDIAVIRSGRIAGTDYTDAVSVDVNETLMLVLRKTGRAELTTRDGSDVPYTIPAYADVVQAVLGETHTVLLHAGGTVTAFGDNSHGQCNVSGWTDIAAVAVGQHFTLGLKTDGTVVAAGSNSCGQCNVADYRNVVDVAACNQTAVMLHADGTVSLAGYRSLGLADAEKLIKVRRIEAASSGIIAEKVNGSFEVISGQDGGEFGYPYNWRNIVSFDAGQTCIVGVDKNGVLFTSGDGIAESK
ncbi:MAG: hypothetical protein E7632_12495, partial [Ruminococcaceae bacterium]|nr:hypothetical protein [Oscillospiraceae bacterium]